MNYRLPISKISFSSYGNSHWCFIEVAIRHIGFESEKLKSRVMKVKLVIVFSKHNYIFLKQRFPIFSNRHKAIEKIIYSFKK